MKINEQGNDVMDALGITVDRCEELCTAIEKAHEENPDWTLGKIINHAQTDICQNENEVAFMLYVFGRHSGMAQGVAMGELKNLFSKLFSGQESRSSRRQREEMAEQN